MDIEVKNADKNDKTTRRKIYEAIYKSDFGEFKLFTKAFTEHYKIIQTIHKIFHLKSIRRLKPSL